VRRLAENFRDDADVAFADRHGSPPRARCRRRHPTAAHSRTTPASAASSRKAAARRARV
jgi:hypothetical protein